MAKKPHYFVDCDYFNEDDQLWHGDLGWEANLCDTEAKYLEEAINHIVYYFKEGIFEEEHDVNETFVMFSIFEGVWNNELEEWTYENAHDRQSKIKYRIFSGSKEFAERYGIKADMYMGFGA